MKDLWKELEELEKEYKDILDAINKEFRKELRKIG
ncbi:RNA-binding protein, partial [Candidatus Shapirobacteria bacterium]